MKKVLIIGANGKVGKILTRKMKRYSEFIPIALFKNENQKSFFEKINVSYKIVSLEDDIESLSNVITGMDAIVFTAGSGGMTGYDKTLIVDLDGAVKSMEAAIKSKVKRFVMVSALRADNRNSWEKSSIKPYYVAKHYADRILKSIGLDYTIVRPGRLFDKPGTGKITTTDPEAKAGVSREDVASLILEVLRNDNTIGKTIEFNEGDIPIPEIIRRI